ncbi:MAG: heparinase II/III family protein [Clostridia bacterium]|nr:heparinase II/III family protein [Clostridia bacterium]
MNTASRRALLAEAHRITAYAAAHFDDRVERLSGWAHNFVCPDCASRIPFDIDLKYDPPHNVFTCDHCGKTVSSTDHDEAWVYSYRQVYANYMEALAAAALDGNPDAIPFMQRYLDFYADHYAEFPVHGRWAGKGKIMGQGLCEAVWAIAVLRGFYPVRQMFSAEKWAKWHRILFRPLAELLIPQAQKIHNIPCWLWCAVGMIGIAFDDEELLHEAVDGEFGVRNQVEKGFTKNGLWYEGSLHYHYYTAEGLTYFLSLYAKVHPDDPLIERLTGIYCAPLALSHDGYRLQSTNDGWYPRTLEDYATQIHRAAALTGSDRLVRQVETIRQYAPDSLKLPYALLIEKPTPACELWTETNLAIFDEPLKFILKSGVIAPSHRHRDCLSVILPPYSDDLGTPGYGHPLTPGWYRLAASHNCVTVDQNQPAEMIPTHIEAVENGARAVVDGGWKEVTSAARTVTREEENLLDVTEITCSGTHTVDWLLHLSGEVTHNGSETPADALGEQFGYQHFTRIRRIGCEGEFTLRTGALTVKISSEGEIYLADSPDNPANGTRTSVIVRTVGETASVRAVYSIEE